MNEAIDGKITFMGNVSHFLGIKFEHHIDSDNNKTIFLTQTAFIESLANILNISNERKVTNPYRSGLPIDKLPPGNPPYDVNDINLMRKIVGSLLWIAQSTRPDISTITNLLSSYQTIPTPAHIQAAKRVVAYLLTTKYLGISFTSNANHHLTTFQHFPVDPSQLFCMTDAN